MISASNSSGELMQRPAPATPLPFPVFVVNMARDVERRQHMSAMLAEAGITPEFVAAVDGSRLTEEDRAPYDRARALRIYGVEMSNSEIGCYLSHYRLYERMVREGLEMALILEDDISLSRNMGDVLLSLVGCDCKDWLVVRLDTKRDQVSQPTMDRYRGVRVAELVEGAALYRLRTRVLGTGAYLIRLAGARRMIAYGRKIFMPIDQTMDRYWENGIRPYVVRPLPAYQTHTFGSHSGERSVARRRAQPFSVRQRRRLQRIVDAFAKRIFNLFSV